jgi:hypothetical protein
MRSPCWNLSSEKCHFHAGFKYLKGTFHGSDGELVFVGLPAGISVLEKIFHQGMIHLVNGAVIDRQ